MGLRFGRTLIAAATLAAVSGTMAWSDAAEDIDLVVNEEITLVTRAEPPAHLDGALPEILSGWLFREDETRTMQMDDFSNPAMVFVDKGVDLWNAVDGSEGKSCASCRRHCQPESHPRHHAKDEPCWG